MSKLNGNILLTKPVENMQAAWEWQNQANGLVKWTYTNPNNVQMTAILVRGVEQNGNITEIYPFANAFFPLYWQNFGIPFQVGNPSPLVDRGVENNQPPLGIIKNNNGSKFVAFVFTLSPKQSWSMLEGGFTGTSPAAIEMHTALYNHTDRFTIAYSRVQQCDQYNKQSGSNFSCPADPMTVESALFSIIGNVVPLIPVPISTQNQQNAKCYKKLKKAFRKGDIVNFLKALNCILGH